MTAVLEAGCTVLSGILLFSTKGKELGISWLLFAIFLGVFGSYEALHQSDFPFEEHIFLHSFSYLVFGWTGLLLGLLLVDNLIHIITFNTVAVVSYEALTSVAQLRPVRLWFFSKVGISILLGLLIAMLTHSWPLQTLHTCAVILGAFLVASGTQVLVSHSDSIITSVTKCAELVWSDNESDQRICYPTYILWPTLIIAAVSVRAKRNSRVQGGSLEESLMEQSYPDDWLPQLPFGLHRLQKALKALVFRIVPGCMRECCNFLALAEHATGTTRCICFVNLVINRCAVNTIINSHEVIQGFEGDKACSQESYISKHLHHSGSRIPTHHIAQSHNPSQSGVKTDIF